MSQSHWISICSQWERKNQKGEVADSYNLVVLGVKKNLFLSFLFFCFHQNKEPFDSWHFLPTSDLQSMVKAFVDPLEHRHFSWPLGSLSWRTILPPFWTVDCCVHRSMFVISQCGLWGTESRQPLSIYWGGRRKEKAPCIQQLRGCGEKVKMSLFLTTVSALSFTRCWLAYFRFTVKDRVH